MARTSAPSPRPVGRPPLLDALNTTVRLTPRVKARLMAEAARRRCSLAAVIEAAVDAMVGGEEERAA